MKVKSAVLFLLASVVVNAILNSQVAVALPWDQDMFKQQSLKPNEIARRPAEGTVAVGQTPFIYDLDQAGSLLKNPVSRGNKMAEFIGERLWKIQCSSCHGVTGKADGPLSGQLPVPDLHQDLYKSRPDGRIYGVIHLGQGAMPRYGYKLTDFEKWTLVNHVRKLQEQLSGK